MHQAFGRNYQLPNTTAHNETCANIAGAMWNWRMFLLTGEAKYVDLVELALYNSILSGVSLSGTEYFYVNPLRVVDPLPVELRYPRTRQKFFTSFCCPPNVVRTIAEVGGYAYGKTDDAILVNLYGSNTLETELAGGKVKLTQQTNYPWDGKVRITVNECPDNEFAIKLRIPGWCEGATVKVNNQSPSPVLRGGARGGAVDRGVYSEVFRLWKPGDAIQLNFPMPAELIEAHPLVEETANQVAIKRGPVVYCLESADLPEGTRRRRCSGPRRCTTHTLATMPVCSMAWDVVETTAVAESPTEWSGELYRPKQAIASKDIPLRLDSLLRLGQSRGRGDDRLAAGEVVGREAEQPSRAS